MDDRLYAAVRYLIDGLRGTGATSRLSLNAWDRVSAVEEILNEQAKAEPDLVEAHAALSHAQWAGWATWMLKCLDSPERDEHIARWRRQIQTPYTDLSEKEKESDRVEARKHLELMATMTAHYGGERCGAVLESRPAHPCVLPSGHLMHRANGVRWSEPEAVDDSYPVRPPEGHWVLWPNGRLNWRCPPPCEVFHDEWWQGPCPLCGANYPTSSRP